MSPCSCHRLDRPPCPRHGCQSVPEGGGVCGRPFGHHGPHVPR